MTFTILFLILVKVTFDEHVNVLKMYCKCDISYIYKTLIFPKLKVLKGIISYSESLLDANKYMR